jgi:DNA topoisomerase-1
MVLKSGRRGPFMACSAYPECRFTMDIDEDGNVSKPEKVDVTCEECGKPMVVRSGRRGKFLGCSGYPECRNTKPLPGTGGGGGGGGGAGKGGPRKRRGPPKTTDIDCPQCGQKLVMRDGRRGKFLGCSGYPECRHTQDLPPELSE